MSALKYENKMVYPDSPTGTTKQHAFFEKVRQNSVGLDYSGNQSLCSSLFLAGDDALALIERYKKFRNSKQ